MLTDIQKQKIGLLRQYFTDSEWDSLSSSDELALDLINRYSSQIISSIQGQIQVMQGSIDNMTSQVTTLNNKLSTLQQD